MRQELSETGARVWEQEPMSKHTSLAIGGPADWYVEAQTVDQLARVLGIAARRAAPVFFLGAGSDLLVSDAGIEGIVLRLRGDFETVAVSGSRARAGAGVFLPTLVKQCAERDLGGIEPLAGVPGTVGGALIMNAGTRELEIGAVVHSVEVLAEDGALETIPRAQIRFEYRRSSLAGRLLCFATLQLQPARKDDIMRTVQQHLDRRWKTQPIGTLNVGSIFKNPAGGFAAELIERCGLKGLKKGNAQVSPKHANFIVNCGGARAQDVRDLIFEVQAAVLQKCGVRLEPEVRMVGR